MKPYACFFFVLAASLLLPGCMSGVYQSSLVPRSQAHSGVGDGVKYTIAKVQVQVKGEGQTPSGIITLTPTDTQEQVHGQIAMTNETWRELLNAAAVGRHPALFTTDYPAVPLAVSIDATADNSIGASIAAELCTLCILGGILPLPFKEDAQMTISVVPLDAGGAAAPPFMLTRKNSMWLTVFTPLALIPYPAHSDIPRTTLTLPQMLDVQSMTREGQRVYSFTADCIIEGIVREMEKNPKAFAAPCRTLPPQPSPGSAHSLLPPPVAIPRPQQPPPADEPVY